MPLEAKCKLLHLVQSATKVMGWAENLSPLAFYEQSVPKQEEKVLEVSIKHPLLDVRTKCKLRHYFKTL